MKKTTMKTKMFHRELVKCGLFEDAHALFKAMLFHRQDVFVSLQAGHVGKLMGFCTEEWNTFAALSL